MPDFNPPKYSPGDVLTADLVNKINAAIREGRKVRVGSGLTSRQGAGGLQLAAVPIAPVRLHWARVPSGGVAAATGTWPSLSASSFTADVYKGDGANLALAAEDATVYWRYLDGADAGKLVPCVPNGDGTFDAVLDSCTAIDED